MKKQVKIEKVKKGLFEVYTTECGNHWYMVFRGNERQVNIICDAYTRIGYQR